MGRKEKKETNVAGPRAYREAYFIEEGLKECEIRFIRQGSKEDANYQPLWNVGRVTYGKL